MFFWDFKNICVSIPSLEIFILLPTGSYSIVFPVIVVFLLPELTSRLAQSMFSDVLHTCISLHIQLLCFCFCLFLLQGARVLSLYAGYFSHPDLTRLASVLPLCALRKRVDSTTDRYSSAFEKSIGLAASSYNEISFVLNYLVSTFLNQELLLLVQALRGYFSRWCYDKSKNTYFKGNLITFVSVSKSLQLRLSFFIFKVRVISTCQ